MVPGLPEDLTRRPGRPDSLWAVPGNVRAVPRAVSFLRDLAEREGASVLYGQGTWANILSALAARGSATGAVWHIRNDFRPRLKRLVMRGVARACGVRAIVAVSRSAAAPLEGLPMPLHVVENGADLAASDAARNAPDNLRQRLGIPEAAVVACYAGRLLPHKGIHVLMEAARRALRREARLHLVILGDNPGHAARDVRGELQQQASSWGLADRIHVAGWVPAVERALVGLDFVVIPSTCRECCSRSLIESLCLGLPVVASHVGGNPELLQDGVDGLLVPPGDPERLAEALVALASDDVLRRRLATGAFEARRRFDSVTVAAARGGRPPDGREGDGHGDERARPALGAVMRAAAGAVLLLALCGTGCGEPPRQWSIGIYRGTTPFDLTPSGPQPALAAKDLGIDAEFVADPFLFRRDDRLFLFFEAWRRGTKQGDIAWAERTSAGAWRFGGVALDEPFHLSYPFIFEHEGEVYLIPESNIRREVRLYVARPFPSRFELRRVLLSGKHYSDSCLVPLGGALLPLHVARQRHAGALLRRRSRRAIPSSSAEPDRFGGQVLRAPRGAPHRLERPGHTVCPMRPAGLRHVRAGVRGDRAVTHPLRRAARGT